MNWYYARGDQRMGPVDDDEMTRLVSAGIVNPQSLVWNETMTDWKPYAEVVPVAAPVEIPGSLYGDQAAQPCAECGRATVREEMISYQGVWVCAACKETFFQRVREGGAALHGMRYGGFWIRFFARFIDGCILGLVGVIQSFVQTFLTGQSAFEPNYEPTGSDVVIMLVSMAFSTIIAAVYEIYFIGKHGATPGKMVFGLKVVFSDGRPVGFGRATGRFFATYLSSMTLLIGYLIAAFDSEKRALHDHICDTRVIRN